MNATIAIYQYSMIGVVYVIPCAWTDTAGIVTYHPVTFVVYTS